MKKTLLLMGSLAVGFAASALHIETLPDMYSLHQSPNGRYIVSEGIDGVVVYDATTGDVLEFFEEGVGVGNGNCVSNSGRVVGNINDDDAAVLIDGEWVKLPVPEYTVFAYPQAITPDDKVIVGMVNGQADAISGTGVASIPVVWTLNEAGNYECQLIPYPTLDPVTNMIPQYVQPVCVSADGRRAFGQITHYTGFFQLPIAFELNDKNEWTYSYPGIDLFNPNHVEVPEEPAEYDVPFPEYTDFMTPEEAEAYNKAMEDYYASGYDEDLYPEPWNYMTAEEIDAYNEASDAYNAGLDEWYVAFDAYFDAINEVTDSSPSLQFNQVFCSPDGKTVIYNASIGGGGWWAPATPSAMQVDMTTGKAAMWSEDAPYYCSGIFNDGTILGHTGAGMMATEPTQGYIKESGAEEFESIYDYFNAQDEFFADWAQKNWEHEYLVDYVYDEELDDYVEIYGKKIASGVPTASDDLSVINTSLLADWEGAEFYYYVYHFTGVTSGVKNVSVDSAISVKSLGKGMLSLTGAANVEIYTANGACVYNAAAEAGAVNTGLASGIYVVKATDAKGNVTVAKVAF